MRLHGGRAGTAAAHRRGERNGEVRDTVLRKPSLDADEVRVRDGQVVTDGEHHEVVGGDICRPEEECCGDVGVDLVGLVVGAAHVNADGVRWGAPVPGDVGGHAFGDLVGGVDCDLAGLAGDAGEVGRQREKEDRQPISSGRRSKKGLGSCTRNVRRIFR